MGILDAPGLTKAVADRAYTPAAVLEMVTTKGDSLTRAEGVDYATNTVAPILGIPVANDGKAGWSSSDIAMLQGGLQPKLTVTGNQIPASGAVTVTALDPATSYRTDGTGAFSWLGILAGIPGTLRHDMTGGTWTFTRTTAGNATSCPAGTPFICTEADGDVSKVQIISCGRNNLTAGGPVLNDVIRDIDLMVRHLRQSPRRYIVWSMLPRAASDEWIGGSTRKLIDQLNSWLKLRHGEHYVDIATPVVERGLAMAGLPATAQDLLDISHGVIPESLRGAGDTTHFNAAGYTVLGKLLADKAVQLGYSVGKLPVIAPGQVVGLAAGAATSSTQALTWTVAAGADGYLIRKKGSADSVPVLAQTSGSASVTVANLPTAGVPYDYQVAAVNAAGVGPWSATVTASTTGTPAVVLGSDSFNRTDSGTPGTLDNALGGSGTRTINTSSQIGIVGNKLARTSATSTRFWWVDFAVTDGYAEDVVTLSDTGDVCVVGRYADASNYYRVIAAATGTLQLSKTVAGTTTSLLGTAIVGAVVSGDRVGIRIIGSTIQAVVNGVVRATVTDTALTAGTNWGGSFPASLVPNVDSFIMYDR